MTCRERERETGRRAVSKLHIREEGGEFSFSPAINVVKYSNLTHLFSPQSTVKRVNFTQSTVKRKMLNKNEYAEYFVSTLFAFCICFNTCWFSST